MELEPHLLSTLADQLVLFDKYLIRYCHYHVVIIGSFFLPLTLTYRVFGLGLWTQVLGLESQVLVNW